MKYHVIDNSLKDLGKIVLWQYDKAVRLLSVMKHMQVLYHCAVEQFWDWWTKRVLSIDTLDAFGCSLWGMFLGVPRPTIIDGNGTKRLIATSVYRKILKGAFYLTKASSSFEDKLGYIEIVFGVSGEDSLSKWTVYVSEYGWTTNIDELNDRYQTGRAYQEGDIFWWSSDSDQIGGNWKCLRYIKASDNISFESLHDNGWIAATKEYTNGMRDDDTVLLKLIDPEGIVRKIGGAPSNSLSVSVEYTMGETTIRAEATRRRKCGVSLSDNYDLTINYAKSPYYDEMHKDQKALFEQKINELLPYPLGIGIPNNYVTGWVVGFNGQSNVLYQPNRSYSTGDVFGFAENNGEGRNYICVESITENENKSFDSIRGKVRKTDEGGPFVGTFSEDIKSYLDFRNISQKFCLPPSSYSTSLVADQGIVPKLVIHAGYSYGVVHNYNGDCIIFGANKISSRTAIDKGELFIGYDQGIYKIFLNTSDRVLVVQPKSDEEYMSKIEDFYKSYAPYFDYIVSEDYSAESLCGCASALARKWNCPTFTAYQASTFIPGTTYGATRCIDIDGELRRFTKGVYKCPDKKTAIEASVPLECAGVHGWYPYIPVDNRL